MVTVKRFDVGLVKLDPAFSTEIQKTRPCVIISPDSMNLSKLKTIIIAPLTSTIRLHFPTRIKLKFQNKNGQIALDQLRCVDRGRLVKIIGKLEKSAHSHILDVLKTMFS